MPETACLHIQARDTDPIRVVELPGVSVRIGRASYCEVRLSEPDVADEECRLRRRGGAWHLYPARRDGSVRLDGRAVEQPCPIPFDVPFRVGDHWLTLRTTGGADPDWDSYRTPPARDLSSDFRTPLDDASIGSARGAAVAVPDYLTTLQARPEPRPGATRDSRRWEERWKAAGERLRARAEAPPPARPDVAPPDAALDRFPEGPGPSADLHLRPAVRMRPVARRASDFGIAPVSYEAAPPPIVPPVAPISPSPASSPRFRPADAPGPVPYEPPPARRVRPSPGGQAYSRPIRPETGPWPPSPARPGAPETRDDDPPTPEPDKVAPLTTDDDALGVLTFLPPAGDLGEIDHSDPIQPDVSGHASQDVETLESLADEGVLSTSSTDEPGDESTDPEGPAAEEGGDLDEAGTGPQATWGEVVAGPHTELDRESSVEDQDGGNPTPIFTLPLAGGATQAQPSELLGGCLAEGGAGATDERCDGAGRWAYEALFETRMPGPQAVATGPGPAGQFEGTAGPARRPRRSSARARRAAAPARPGAAVEDLPRELPFETSGREWPTARDIFAANRLLADRAGTLGRRARQPVPTEPRGPGQWSVPPWLGLPFAMALALTVGFVGVGAAWTWSGDAFAAGQVANRLMGAKAGAAPDPLPETIVRPEGPWWTTSAASLVPWALFVDRADAGKPGAAEEVEAILEAASQASPLDPQVRFAMSRPVPRPGRGISLFRGLGQGRDVVTLAWSGHQLLAAGKKETALRAYREALEMASRAEPTRLGMPAYNDDPQARRYALPHEALIGAVVRDMADPGLWAASEWSKALPDFAVAPLVAARLFRERGEADAADRALDSIVAQAESDPPAGTSAAVHLAAQAEALALKSRWAEAEGRYRQAIGLMPDDTIRRTWWMNLADIAQRLNDEPRRQAALEAARGKDAGDAIARRALEALKFTASREGAAKP